MALVFSGLTIPPAAALNAAGRPAAERQLPAAASRSVVPLVYGRDRLAGLVLNVLPAAAGSSTLLVQVLWCFACDGFEDVRWNEQPLPAGATVTHFDGTQTTPHAALVTAMAAQGITYTSTLNGFAYSVFAIPTRLFEGQLSFTATIRGRRLYDPRLDSTNGGTGTHRLATPSTWAFSTNPALALADLLRDTVYGAGRTVNWASVITAANHCAALIGSPAEARRTVGVSFTSPTELDAAVEAMRAYAGCFLLPASAGVTLVPDQDGAAVASYVHANGDIAAMEPLTLRDQSALPTAVEVIWTDTSRIPWRDAGHPPVTLAGAGTTRPYRLQQVRMPGVQRYSQAVREATERLNKLNLGEMTTVLEVFDVGLRHEVGDIVNVTHPVGITAKPFRISAPPEMAGPGRWRLSLVEHDPAMYSTAVATAPTIPDTSLLSPAGPPPDVVVGQIAISVGPGAVVFSLPVPPVVDIVALEIRRGASWAAGVRLEDGAAGSTSVEGTRYLWTWAPVGTHTLWFRWRDGDGNVSATAVSTSVVVAQGAQGISAAELTAQISGGNLCRNSGFEADANGDGLADAWAVYWSGSTGAQAYSRNATGRRGSQSQRVYAAALGTTASDRIGLYQDIPVSALTGRPVIWSVWSSVLAGNGCRARVYIDWLNGATFIGAADSGELTVSADGVWRRQEVRGVVPANATTARVYWWLQRSTVAAVTFADLDDCQFVVGDVLSDWAPRSDELLNGSVTTPILAQQAATVVALASNAGGTLTWNSGGAVFASPAPIALQWQNVTDETVTVLFSVSVNSLSEVTGVGQTGQNTISISASVVSALGSGLFDNFQQIINYKAAAPVSVATRVAGGSRSIVVAASVPFGATAFLGVQHTLIGENAGDTGTRGAIIATIEAVLR